MGKIIYQKILLLEIVPEEGETKVLASFLKIRKRKKQKGKKKSVNESHMFRCLDNNISKTQISISSISVNTNNPTPHKK